MNAREQRLLAQENWREAQSRQLAQRAFEALGHRAHDEAIQLAVLAWRLGRTDQARDAMRRVVGSAGGVTTVLGEHTPGIATLAFTPDSQGLVSVARDGSMMIWAYDARGWRLAGKLLELPRSANALREDEVRVQAIGFGSRGRHLLAWHRNGNAWWWDLDAGSSQRIETGLLDGQTLWHAAVSPRGDWVVFSSDEWLSSWALPAGPALRASMPAGQRVTLAACFVDDTTVRVLVGNRQSDETVRLLEWDLATHRLSAGPTVLRPQQQYVRAPGLQATFSHDCQQIVLWHKRGAAVWQVGPGLKLKSGPALASSLRDLSGHGDVLAWFGRRNSRVLLAAWDETSPEKKGWHWQYWSLDPAVGLVESGLMEDSGVAPARSPDDRWFASAGCHGIVLWECNLGIHGTQPPQRLAVNCKEYDDGCAERLCEKVSQHFDREKVSQHFDREKLRSLFGIANFESFYETYQSIIYNATCGARQ